MDNVQKNKIISASHIPLLQPYRIEEYVNSKYALKLRKPCSCQLFHFKQLIPQPIKIPTNKRGHTQNLILIQNLLLIHIIIYSGNKNNKKKVCKHSEN